MSFFIRFAYFAVSITLFSYVQASDDITTPNLTLGLKREWQIEERFLNLESPLYLLEFGLRPNEEKSHARAEVSFFPTRETPTHTKHWRLGFAFESDQGKWDLNEPKWNPEIREYKYTAEGRAYFLIRRDMGWSVIKAYWPLAQTHNGEEWPYRLRMERLRIYLKKSQSLSLALTGLLDYQSDSNLETDWGLYCKKDKWEIEIRDKGFSVSYTINMGEARF